MPSLKNKLALWAKAFKQQTLVVYCAARDRRTPTPVRVLALAVAAYALSPIDLIPDFIPVLGYLDDLILLPLGIALIIRLTPPEVIQEARQKASELAERPTSYSAVAIILVLWALLALASYRWLAALWR
jgi:uncharacterized membrane protein YkvA (DUF1232 family)